MYLQKKTAVFVTFTCPGERTRTNISLHQGLDCKTYEIQVARSKKCQAQYEYVTWRDSQMRTLHFYSNVSPLHFRF